MKTREASGAVLKMLVDGASAQERPLVHAMIRHLLVGSAIGIITGAAGFLAILLSMGQADPALPLLFCAAIVAQAALAGAIIGLGIFLARIAETAEAPMDRSRAASFIPHQANIPDRPLARHSLSDDP